jgi:gamma-glutamyl phosphate reductase
MASSSTSSAVKDIAELSKLAFHASQTVTGSERIAALNAIRQELETRKDAILEANKLDMEVRELSPGQFNLLKSN